MLVVLILQILYWMMERMKILQVFAILQFCKFSQYFANIIETECLWYCFSTILQNDLNSAKDHWNTHRIRKSRFQTIHGRPNVLYEIPSRSRGQECLKLTISNEMFNQTAASVTEEQYPKDYQEYFSYLMEVLERRQPETW